MNNFPRVTIRLLYANQYYMQVRNSFSVVLHHKKVEKTLPFSAIHSEKCITRLLCICCVKTCRDWHSFVQWLFMCLHVWMNEEKYFPSSSLPSSILSCFPSAKNSSGFLDTLAKQNSLYPHGVRFLLDKHYWLLPLSAPSAKTAWGTWYIMWSDLYAEEYREFPDSPVVGLSAGFPLPIPGFSPWLGN